MTLGYHSDAKTLSRRADFKPLHGEPRWHAVVARAHANELAQGSSPELAQMFDQDQEDRVSGGLSPGLMSARDDWRLRRVRQLVASGHVRTADDHYRAAMVFQHGPRLEDVREAHRLAVKAAELEPEHPLALWLAAAAKDRELQRLGKPQLYGTQFSVRGGRVLFYKIDPSITDAERAEWQVRPPAVAAEAYRRSLSPHRH